MVQSILNAKTVTVQSASASVSGWAGQATVNGTAIDTAGFGTCKIFVGLFVNNTPVGTTFALNNSDDNSTWVAISGSTQTLTSSSQTGIFQWDLDLNGLNADKRYIQLVASPSGTSTNKFNFASYAILGDPVAGIFNNVQAGVATTWVQG